MPGRFLLAALAAVALAAPAARAEAPAGPTYALSFEVRDHGALIGHPQIVVREDSTSSVAVEGPDGYRIASVLSRLADREDIAFKIYIMRDGASKLIAAPRMTLAAGTPGRLDIGGDDGFSLKISVLPVLGHQAATVPPAS